MTEKTIFHAYTTTCDAISFKLLNEVIIQSNEKQCRALAQWDTGASGTCISEDIASKLGLIPTGKQLIRTPSGSSEVDTYLIDILLPNNVIVRDKMVCGTKIGDQGIQVLIGMDIVALGDFAISNYGGRTVFSFRTPSKETTDYVKQIGIENKIGQRHGKGKRKKKR